MNVKQYFVTKNGVKEERDTYAMAVVRNLDEFEAAVLDDDVDGCCLGVEAVFDELFNGGNRSLNDLPGSDSIDNGLVETEDFGGFFTRNYFFFFPSGVHGNNLVIRMSFHGSSRSRDVHSSCMWCFRCVNWQEKPAKMRPKLKIIVIRSLLTFYHLTPCLGPNFNRGLK